MFNWFKKRKTKKEESRKEKMMKEPYKPIITNKIELERPCEEAKSEEVEAIIYELEKTMLHKKGFGLSANQIGINKKVAIIRMPGYELNLVNPEILKGFNKFVNPGEGCLSFEGIRVNTVRYKNVIVRNNYKETKEFPVRDFPAVAWQHEVDHLNGLTIFDRKHKNVKSKTKGATGKTNRKGR